MQSCQQPIPHMQPQVNRYNNLLGQARTARCPVWGLCVHKRLKPLLEQVSGGHVCACPLPSVLTLPPSVPRKPNCFTVLISMMWCCANREV